MAKSKAAPKLSKVYNATLPIAALKSHAQNYKVHPDSQLSDLEASLARWSQVQSVVVHDQGDGSYTIIAGHGLIEAARREGFTEIDARVMGQDWPREEASGYLVADNKLGEKAEDDLERLTELLQEQLDAGYPLESMGSSLDDLEALLQELEAQTVGGGARDVDDPSGGGDDFDTTPDEGETRCKPGDLWQLGKHRLLCGDSTKQEDVARLMEGEKASMVFTDPPYNCADEMEEGFYAGSNSPAMKELSTTQWDQGFDPAAFLAVLTMVRPEHGTVYICTSHMLAPIFWRWMKEQKATHNSYCVWCKPNPMPSLAKRHPTWATEIICYATFGKHTFNFPSEGHALNWWQVNKNAANDLHPTQKPLDIPATAIQYSSNEGDTVADFFLGSGTTLIACERLARRCYGIEIEPRYVDVCLKRWETETGQEAKLLERVGSDANVE